MTDVIVLGLDGATWDILSPLIDEGRLPNIEQVCSAGQSGTLESTFPPITAPAWLSMATGKNPGKTGVFYFLNRESPDSFDFTAFGSDKFQGQSFWDVLHAQDQSVGIFNYPMLYPPYDIDGFMVSGLGSGEDDPITAPASLADELEEVTDGYRLKVSYADAKYQGRPEKLERDLLDIIEKRETALEYLLAEYEVDHFFGVVSATDWAQHYFWRYHDEDHVLFDPEAGNRDALARIWERVDETVGIVADYARTEDATLLLVSDHGFGPVNRTFHVSEWLEQTGFSSPVDQSVSEQLRTKYFPYVRRIGEAVVRLVPPLNTFARSVGESIRKPPSEIVDFERSTAFAPKQSLTCGMVYLLSDDPADKQQVTDELNALAENDDRIDAIEIHDPADIYTGPKAALAPDLMVEVDNFECAVDPRPTTDGAIVSEGPSSEPRSGGHNQEGVIVAAGPDIDAGGDLDASIYDVAPTVLSLHGTAIPEGVDGTVIEEIVAAGGDPSRRPIAELTEFGETTQRDDDEAVQDRLEDLGYI